MRIFPHLAAAIALGAAALLPPEVCAQEKAGSSSGSKGARKSLTFQPGAKTPDEAPASSTPAAAASSPVAMDGPGKAVAEFFAMVQRGQIEEAYTMLTKGSKIADRPDEIGALKSRTQDAINLFGPLSGFDLVDHKAAGRFLVRRTYLSLGRDYPLRWRFYFYFTENQWRLVDLRVDDRLGAMFDEDEESQPEAGKAPERARSAPPAEQP